MAYKPFIPASNISVPSSILKDDANEKLQKNAQKLIDLYSKADDSIAKQREAYNYNILSKAIDNQYKEPIRNQLLVNFDEDKEKVLDYLKQNKDITASEAKEIINKELIDKYKQVASEQGLHDLVPVLNKFKEGLTETAFDKIIAEKAFEDASPALAKIYEKYNSDPEYASTQYSKDLNSVIESVADKYAGDDDLSKVKLMQMLKKETSLFDTKDGNLGLREYLTTKAQNEKQDKLLNAINFVYKNQQGLSNIVKNSKTNADAVNGIVNWLKNNNVDISNGMNAINKVYGGLPGLYKLVAEQSENNDSADTDDTTNTNNVTLEPTSTDNTPVGSESINQNTDAVDNQTPDKTANNLINKTKNQPAEKTPEELLKSFLGNGDKYATFNTEIPGAVQPKDVTATISKEPTTTELGMMADNFFADSKAQSIIGPLTENRIKRIASKTELVGSNISDSIKNINNIANSNIALKRKYFDKNGKPTEELIQKRNKAIARHLNKLNDDDIMTLYRKPDIIENLNVDEDTKNLILGYIQHKYNDVLNNRIKKANLIIRLNNPKKTLTTIKAILTITNNLSVGEELNEEQVKALDEMGEKGFLKNIIKPMLYECQKSERCPLTDVSKITNFEQLKTISDFVVKYIRAKQLKDIKKENED